MIIIAVLIAYIYLQGKVRKMRSLWSRSNASLTAKLRLFQLETELAKFDSQPYQPSANCFEETKRFEIVTKAIFSCDDPYVQLEIQLACVFSDLSRIIHLGANNDAEVIPLSLKYYKKWVAAKIGEQETEIQRMRSKIEDSKFCKKPHDCEKLAKKLRKFRQRCSQISTQRGHFWIAGIRMKDEIEALTRSKNKLPAVIENLNKELEASLWKNRCLESDLKHYKLLDAEYKRVLDENAKLSSDSEQTQHLLAAYKSSNKAAQITTLKQELSRKNEIIRRLETEVAVKNEKHKRNYCVLCLEADANIVFTSCMHLCTCQGCSVGVEECPICELKVSEILRVQSRH